MRTSVLLMTLAVAGCTHDRSAGTVLDDHTIEVGVIDAIYSSPEIGEESHIKVEAHERMVLLTGETDTEAKRELAGERAAEIAWVDRVVNDIAVAERASTGTRFNNSWLTAKVNTALLTGNTLEGFDPARIKVLSSNGTVYLMGKVSRSEGDAVAEVARNVHGVSKVVKIFTYTD